MNSTQKKRGSNHSLLVKHIILLIYLLILHIFYTLTELLTKTKGVNATVTELQSSTGTYIISVLRDAVHAHKIFRNTYNIEVREVA